MPVIGVDEHKFEFITFGQFADDTRIVRDVEADPRGQFGKKFNDLEASRARLINQTGCAIIDCIDPGRSFLSMLSMESGRDDRRRKSPERPDFNHARWSKNTHESGQKKTIAHSNSTLIYLPIINSSKEFHLARQRSFARVFQYGGKMAIG